jgi:hypothetical protein
LADFPLSSPRISSRRPATGGRDNSLYTLEVLTKSGLGSGSGLDWVCLVGSQSDIRDQRYWTELDTGTFDIELKSAESNIISDIGIYDI